MSHEQKDEVMQAQQLLKGYDHGLLNRALDYVQNIFGISDTIQKENVLKMNQDSYDLTLLLNVQHRLQRDDLEDEPRFGPLFTDSVNYVNEQAVQPHFSDFSSASEETKRILRSQLYIRFHLESYSAMQKNVTISRVGSLPEQTFWDKIRDSYVIDYLHWFAPISKKLIKKRKYTQVNVKLADAFSNTEFPLRSMNIEVYSSIIGQLQVKSAKVSATTVMTGVRYIMSEWFYVTAFTVIMALTFTMTCCVMVFLLAIKLFFKINL